MPQRFASFREFYPYYLGEHRQHGGGVGLMSQPHIVGCEHVARHTTGEQLPAGPEEKRGQRDLDERRTGDAGPDGG